MGSKWRALAGLAALVAVAASGCGDDGTPAAASGGGTAAEQVTLRLGYFPNITHATGLVGIGSGIFADKLGENVTLETTPFNAGPKVIEALFNGAIDASYIGPNPAINGYARSKGEALRVVSGATSGGAYLVVREGIDSPDDLKGRKIATPQLGNTQDVALRAWLAEQGLETDTAGGGDVSIVPQENAQTLETFVSGTIDGAWVPEPWATRLIDEGGAEVLVDERDLWPDGKYVTTHLIVAKKFLDEHPDVVKRLLEGQVAANEFVNANATEAQGIVNDEIEKVTSKRIKDEVIVAAWPNLTFTNDPIASSLLESARDAESLGLLDPVENLEGIYDLTLLNQVLQAAGLPAVAGPEAGS